MIIWTVFKSIPPRIILVQNVCRNIWHVIGGRGFSSRPSCSASVCSSWLYFAVILLSWRLIRWFDDSSKRDHTDHERRNSYSHQRQSDYLHWNHFFFHTAPATCPSLLSAWGFPAFPYYFSAFKISYKHKNRRTRLLWCGGKTFANVWFYRHSADFDTDWHTLGTRWHIAQLFCIIIMQKTLQTRQTFELFSPKASLSGNYDL